MNIFSDESLKILTVRHQIHDILGMTLKNICFYTLDNITSKIWLKIYLGRLAEIMIGNY